MKQTNLKSVISHKRNALPRSNIRMVHKMETLLQPNQNRIKNIYPKEICKPYSNNN